MKKMGKSRMAAIIGSNLLIIFPLERFVHAHDGVVPHAFQADEGVAGELRMRVQGRGEANRS